MYETCRGVTEDAAEAIQWYLNAAEPGVAGAQRNLGVMSEDGRGVTVARGQTCSEETRLMASPVRPRRLERAMATVEAALRSCDDTTRE